MTDEPDPVTTQRQHLHNAITELPKMDPEIPDAAYLVGWVTIAEFADPDGSRWFCERRGTDGGERDLMPWQVKGYLSHARDDWAAFAISRRLAEDE